MIWTNDFLNRIRLEAEETISRETKCIIDRISLPTQVSQSEFQLPDYVLDVKRVYWKGNRLDPKLNFDSNEANYEIQVWSDGAFNGATFTDAFNIGAFITESYAGYQAVGGDPCHYYYYGFGENVIRIYPSASEVLNSYSDGLWGLNIDKTLLVEFYRTADGETWKIPNYIRRRTIKSYVLWKAFAIEGPGQNIKLSKYHEARYKILIARAKQIIDNVYRTIKETAPAFVAATNESYGEYGYQGQYKVARPILPSNYGITVGED